MAYKVRTLEAAKKEKNSAWEFLKHPIVSGVFVALLASYLTAWYSLGIQNAQAKRSDDIRVQERVQRRLAASIVLINQVRSGVSALKSSIAILQRDQLRVGSVEGMKPDIGALQQWRSEDLQLYDQIFLSDMATSFLCADNVKLQATLIQLKHRNVSEDVIADSEKSDMRDSINFCIGVLEKLHLRLRGIVFDDPKDTLGKAMRKLELPQ